MVIDSGDKVHFLATGDLKEYLLSSWKDLYSICLEFASLSGNVYPRGFVNQTVRDLLLIQHRLDCAEVPFWNNESQSWIEGHNPWPSVLSPSVSLWRYMVETCSSMVTFDERIRGIPYGQKDHLFESGQLISTHHMGDDYDVVLQTVQCLQRIIINSRRTVRDNRFGNGSAIEVEQILHSLFLRSERVASKKREIMCMMDELSVPQVGSGDSVHNLEFLLTVDRMLK